VRLIPIIAGFGLAFLAGAQPKGWQVVKDKTGACQMAVPGDWHINPQVPSMATAPDTSDVMIHAQPGKTMQAIPPGAEKVLGVEKMLENTTQRVIWAGKPASTSPPVIGYHVTAPGKGGTCTAQITVRQGTPESLVKQIGETVGAAK
jgi:hypothetical protein